MEALTDSFPSGPNEEDLGLLGHEELQEEELHIFDPDVFVDEEINPEKVDAKIARDLLELPMEDREKVYFDLHGVAKEVEETPQLVASSLEQFETELERTAERGTYDVALSMNPNYVRNPELRLRFLRADLFNVREAVERFIRHFNIKMELFGPELLCKDIEQDGLNEEDLDQLYDGCTVDIPSRDPAGRLVVCQTAHNHVDIKAILRKLFYTGMVHSEDEETQRKGLVLVSYLVGQEMTWDGLKQRQLLNREYGRMLRACPLRVVALHMCADSMVWRTMFAVIRISSTLFSRLRMREHVGTRKDIMFSLQTFGIPVHEFPIREDGSIDKRSAADRWAERRELERHKRKEQEKRQQQQNHHQQNHHQKDDDSLKKTSSGGKRVWSPGRNDVLMGRGKASYSHPGNVRLRTLVMENIEAYEEAPFSTRCMVSKNILNVIRSRSGHFLKDDGLGWVEVNEDVAVKKISHCFRTFRGARNASNKDCLEDSTGKVEDTVAKKVLSGSKHDR